MAKAKAAKPVQSVSVDLDAKTLESLATMYSEVAVRDRVRKLVAQAGANTFLAQVAGLNVPTTMSDLRLARIYWLVRAGMSLAEADEMVAKLFRVPTPVARRLTSASFARYTGEVLVDDAILKSVQDALDAATWKSPRWLLALPVALVRARIWQALGMHSWPNPEHADGASWKFPNDTFQALREELGLDEKQPPA